MKYFFAIVLASAAQLAASLAVARPVEISETTCFVKEGARFVERACTARLEGGAGVSVLTYKTEEATFEIISDDQGQMLNELPYETYVRNQDFIRSPENEPFAYFCYVSGAAEFCALQPNE